MSQATAPTVHFEDITVDVPDLEKIKAEYLHLQTGWEGAWDREARLAVFEEWDALRRRLATWESWTRLRFDQDTNDPKRKAARKYLDEISPKLTALETQMKRMLLESPDRADVESVLGSHLFALWDADIATFTPAIEPDLTRESELRTQYTELIASAKLTIDGKQVNLAGLGAYMQSADGAMRHEAQRVHSEFFAAHADDFDRIYDELVRLRHKMATTLGFENFVGLGYKRMHRLDFTQADVERYRDQVVEHIVPIATDIIAQRARAMGVPHLQYWDESLTSATGNPEPRGDHDWIVERGRNTMTRVHPQLGDFYSLMIDRHLVDFLNREGKAGGGYCTSFPNYGVPFIFGSFNGTHHDIHLLVHEMGHAFQDWQSKTLPAYDYLTPTYESAEIHSMSLEFLASPFMEQFFASDAERYRRKQLEDAMLFLPYGVAIDHFQHLVYASPEATPAQRHGFWQQMEKRYLPWRSYGDLAYWSKGALWQAKEHLYHVPFYYIDYTLAQCCALQFWVRSQRDYERAVTDYVELCKRGGAAPFLELVRSANLTSPFEAGALSDVGAAARKYLATPAG